MLDWRPSTLVPLEITHLVRAGDDERYEGTPHAVAQRAEGLFGNRRLTSTCAYAAILITVQRCAQGRGHVQLSKARSGRSWSSDAGGITAAPPRPLCSELSLADGLQEGQDNRPALALKHHAHPELRLWLPESDYGSGLAGLVGLLRADESRYWPHSRRDASQYSVLCGLLMHELTYPLFRSEQEMSVPSSSGTPRWTASPRLQGILTCEGAACLV